MLTIPQHYPPTHFHRFCSKMSDPRLRCGYFLFLETWYRYDLTWLQQLRKPATKKFIHVSLLLHYQTMWIQFVRSVLKMCPLWNRLCLTSSVEDFISCISVTSTTTNVIACTLHIQVQDTWQCLSAILKTVAKTNSNLYMSISLLFIFLDFLLTCALNLSVDYISFPTISNKLQ